ncbi:MAG TPA: multifunctional oxoglutarate decarboxylase/oxoglutarate dehydrogenase thiamine pyrophosphate-binding subunit/dihydrolipoyllysine-residue succinyltransferase subunit [Solirubrobacterales bacterium]|nr:multifunctional oxoglutarate decarboxylase/oxoglutarate dehydrogenase thiamine pyrophosphate-binding subunit/dihydrolipoyllysine-residue succinyltransferase subunit [Solirubrobacterales bacterium]
MAATIQIPMPQMGESVSEGTILTWHKQEGDWVAKDETIVEVSTDKVDAEVPAPQAGKLVKILAQEDETVEVGQALAELEPGEAPAGEAAPKKEPTTVAAEGNGAQPAAAAAAPAATATPPVSSDTPSTPVARRVAAAHGIDLDQVSGSGSGGKVVKEDVLAHLERNGGDGAAVKQVRPAPSEPQLTPIRGGDAVLARFMKESLEIPTATSFRTLEVDTLDRRRRQLNESLKTAQREMKVSFTHLIGYAIAVAVRSHPAMGHSFAEVDGKPHRIVHDYVNLGLAVDVQRKDGSRTLVVPVIKGADSMDFAQFREVYEDLIAKTRDGSMSPDDLQGANITLTNPGGIGTVASVPRLMPGQGTIVATGSIALPAGLRGLDKSRIAELGMSKVMTMTSTYDHRVIQGAESGAFLRRIEDLLQGADGFYEDVFRSFGLETPAAPVAEPVATKPTAAPSEEMLAHVQAATSLVKAHRTHGHLAARLDPLGSEPVGDPALEPATVGLTQEVMEQIPAHILRIQVPGATLAEALPHLRETYCGTIAYEIEHISDHQQRVWLRNRIESGKYRRTLSPEEKKRVLSRLTDAEALEVYLHRAFIGAKSFSIEGLDALVPMLDESFGLAADAGVRDVFMGMAHRGRLNVLAHAVGRPYAEILAEFEGEKDIDVVTARPRGGTGDVKYHQGATGTYMTDEGKEITVTLASNPSHLEFVDPVVEGRARAQQTERDKPAAEHFPRRALSLLIHGDAAFPGEGVVAETINLEALDGYSTGGVLHIIANNQIGFTTEPHESRSTRYASDLAKGFDIPIIHVNADDPEACIAAVRLALAYREEWRRGAVIDLIGYRRLGHNEADEPAYTQPRMYALIKQHPPVRKLYADALVAQGIIPADEPDRMLAAAKERLAEAHEDVKHQEGPPTGELQLDRTQSEEPDTTYPLDDLLAVNKQVFSAPEDFKVHPKLAPQRAKRAEIGPDDPVDWGQAEALAFGTLLTQGSPLRLTGQDSARGTFSQRHLVLVDVETGRKYAPLQHLDGAQASFEIHNSPLSEAAAMGFEYGYGVQAPDALVMWEAQFGDFVNAGQVAVDQFIVSGLAKWGETSRLTLLLPHGYEGAGPEHSSAREERFLTLAAEGNIRAANVSTPAQYFHLLRRQALVAKIRPLIVFTPKSLLRNQRSFSPLRELAEGSLRRVIDDPTTADRRAAVTRLLLCTGRIYYDITGHELYEGNKKVAVARVEMLYPFPREEIVELIASYPNLTEILWVQEEPKQMGARRFMFTRNRERELVPEGVKLDYVGREYRASPGEGYPAAHRLEQDRIVRESLSV